MGGHDELECITAACGLYASVLDEADSWSENVASDLTPEDELRAKMPQMLGSLSPGARAMLRDHLKHTHELVAHLHWVNNLYADTNRSSA